MVPFLAFSLSLMALDSEEPQCSLCSFAHNSYSLKIFPCDQAHDADRNEQCILCRERLGVGQHIIKLSDREIQAYFHQNCIHTTDYACESCIESLNHTIQNNQLLYGLKKSFINGTSIVCKSVGALSATGLALYLVYYFSMGPGSSHYCPCFPGISGEDSCREAYDGCNFNLL